MTTADVDAYIDELPEPKRATMQEMRRRILAVIPDAEQRLSYSVPAFAVDGKVVAGLAAFSRHLSYLPHSGSVFDEFDDQLKGYERTKGALHFAVDQPLSQQLIEQLIATKLRLLDER